MVNAQPGRSTACRRDIGEGTVHRAVAGLCPWLCEMRAGERFGAAKDTRARRLRNKARAEGAVIHRHRNGVLRKAVFAV